MMPMPGSSTIVHSKIGRTEFISLMALLMAIAALGVDLMLPALSDIRESYGMPADSTAVAGLVTAYILGLAASQLVYGIMSDRYGRKPLLYAGIGLYIVGGLAAVLAPSFGFLLIARFVWGLGGAGPRVLTLSIVRDSYEGAEMARLMSFILGVFILVPAVAPSIGAFLTDWVGWRGTFGFALLVAVLIGVWSLRLPESLAPENRRSVAAGKILESAKMVVTNKTTVISTLALTLLFGVFLSYIASSELIFAEVFGRGPQFPLIFGAIALVMAVGMFTNSWLVGRFGVTKLVQTMITGYLVASLILASVAIVADGTPGFWVFTVALGLLVLFQSILIPNLNTLAMAPMGAVAGIASAVIGTFSTGLAAVIGAIVDRQFDGTVLPLSLAFALGGIACFTLLRTLRDKTPAASPTDEGVARLDAAFDTPAILQPRTGSDG
jgi:MFS transporter, DHA1 family, multidrug resistance protein